MSTFRDNNSKIN